MHRMPSLCVIPGQPNEGLVELLLSGSGKILQRLAAQLRAGDSQLVVPATALQRLNSVLQKCQAECLHLKDGK
jgi:hypothetical protein